MIRDYRGLIPAGNSIPVKTKIGTKGLERGSRYNRIRRLEMEVLKFGAECGYVILGERERRGLGWGLWSWPWWYRVGLT